MGLTCFAADRFLLSPTREETRVASEIEQGQTAALQERLGAKSIVVLPFVNLSPDPGQAFLADDLVKELLHLPAHPRAQDDFAHLGFRIQG